ncbi:MAG: hypothetical protein RBS07_12980 [Lentimicrobium sp.]|jgi:hypothetical protein|nr:hypothetical protein [Lentimicrobium sp.]
MKKIIILLTFLTFGSLTLLAQPPVPPAKADNGNSGPVGGTAPVGSGLTFLLTLGTLYGVRKIYKENRNFLSKN